MVYLSVNQGKVFLLIVTGLLTWFLFLLIRPFLTYIFLSIILAFTAKPLYNYIKDRIGDKIAAFLTVFFTFLLVFVPLFIVGASIAGDAADVISKIDEPGFIDINRTEARIREFTGQDIDLREVVSRTVTDLSSLSSFGNLASSLGGLSIGLTVMFFLQFYLLKDGEDLVDWVITSSPFPEDITCELLQKTETTLWAVIKGQVLVAIVQGIVAGLGLLIAGISNIFFWTFTMIILSLIPLIGSFGVWGPASLYLVLSNRLGTGIFLFIYGAILVNLTDNFLRPMIVDKSAELHPALILIGVIGGIYLLGPVGVFYGPILFGAITSILTVFKEHYDEI